MKKILVNLMLISSSVVGMNYDFYANYDLNKGLKRENVEQIEPDSIKKQKVDNIICEEFSLVDSDSDYMLSDDEYEEQSELKVDLSVCNVQSQKEMLSLKKKGLNYKIVDAIINGKTKSEICEDLNGRLTSYYNCKTWMNLWSDLSCKTRHDIIESVTHGIQSKTDLGVVMTRSEKKCDLNLIVGLMINPKEVSKDNVECIRYKGIARVWKILAEKRWEPSEVDPKNGKTRDIVLTKKRWDSLEEDPEYVKTRDIVLSIINSDHTSVDGQEINIKKSKRRNFSVVINKWKELGEAKQEEIIKAVKSDETYSGLGKVNRKTGVDLDIDIIVNMLKAKKEKRVKFLKNMNKNMHRIYNEHVKVWEVLAKEKVKVSSDMQLSLANKNTEDFRYLKTRDSVFFLLNSEYRDADGNKVSVSKGFYHRFNAIMFQWKNLGEKKQKKIIDMVKNNESNSSLGSITLRTGTELDIDMIIKMIEKEKGRKKSVLKYKDIDKKTCAAYDRFAQVWEVFAREGIIL